jgi:hypothetical protein
VPSFVPSRSAAIVTPQSKSLSLVSSSYATTRRNDITMMPIGVPKVAYRVPGSQSADWYVHSHENSNFFGSASVSVHNKTNQPPKRYILVSPFLFPPFMYICFSKQQINNAQTTTTTSTMHSHITSTSQTNNNKGSTSTTVCTGNGLFFWAVKLMTNWPIK